MTPLSFPPALLRPALLALAALLLAPGCREKRSPAGDPLAGLAGAEAAYHHTRAILSYGPRPPGSAALQKTRDYLAGQLLKDGWQVGAHSFEADVPLYDPRTGQRTVRPTTFTNLLARFGPADDPDLWTRPVTGLLACHIDSKYYPDRNFLGADDAASAAGVILELARQLSSSPELASRLELVFFDGEEAFGQNIQIDRPPFDGLYGSRAYAQRWRTAPSKPRFGIVLDMIGHKNLRIRYPSDSPPHLARALLEAAEAHRAADRFGPAPHPIIDDHVPLNDAGIPTIDIIGDYTQYAWWHTESDNLANISKESLAITLPVVHHLLNDLLAPSPSP